MTLSQPSSPARKALIAGYPMVCNPKPGLAGEALGTVSSWAAVASASRRLFTKPLAAAQPS